MGIGTPFAHELFSDEGVDDALAAGHGPCDADELVQFADSFLEEIADTGGQQALPLTTQIYFEGDPWIDSDVVGAIKAALVTSGARTSENGPKPGWCAATTSCCQRPAEPRRVRVRPTRPPSHSRAPLRRAKSQPSETHDYKYINPATANSESWMAGLFQGREGYLEAPTGKRLMREFMEEGSLHGALAVSALDIGDLSIFGRGEEEWLPLPGTVLVTDSVQLLQRGKAGSPVATRWVLVKQHEEISAQQDEISLT